MEKIILIKIYLHLWFIIMILYCIIKTHETKNVWWIITTVFLAFWYGKIVNQRFMIWKAKKEDGWTDVI